MEKYAESRPRLEELYLNENAVTATLTGSLYSRESSSELQLVNKAAIAEIPTPHLKRKFCSFTLYKVLIKRLHGATALPTQHSEIAFCGRKIPGEGIFNLQS